MSTTRRATVEIYGDYNTGGVGIFVVPSFTIIYTDRNKIRGSRFEEVCGGSLGLNGLRRLGGTSQGLYKSGDYGFGVSCSCSPRVHTYTATVTINTFYICFNNSFTSTTFTTVVNGVLNFVGFHGASFGVFSGALVRSATTTFLTFIPRVTKLSIRPSVMVANAVVLLVPNVDVNDTVRSVVDNGLVTKVFRVARTIIVTFTVILNFTTTLTIFE